MIVVDSEPTECSRVSWLVSDESTLQWREFIVMRAAGPSVEIQARYRVTSAVPRCLKRNGKRSRLWFKKLPPVEGLSGNSAPLTV